MSGQILENSAFEREFGGPKPHYISFHTTDFCDARCGHCDIWKRPGVPSMPRRELAPILRSISRWLGPVEIQVAGGEPLLSKSTEVLLEECGRLHLPVTLTTNGWHLDEAWADKLSAWGIKHVNFSLDGFQEFHDRMRGVAGSFQRVFEAAKRLTGRGAVKPRVTCVLMRDNLEQMIEFTEFVCSDLFDGIFFRR
ncbi:MAG: radical SAM protein [Deltaproteobacteria bacterium]|nr:radical SAM protein [Deltaproteobacteria bacterium]